MAGHPVNPVDEAGKTPEDGCGKTMNMCLAQVESSPRRRAPRMGVAVSCMSKLLGGYGFGWDVVQDEQGGYGDRGEGVRVAVNIAKFDQARRWRRIFWIHLDHGAYGTDLKTCGEIVSLVSQLQHLGEERLQ
jgi:hypothetical protein